MPVCVRVVHMCMRLRPACCAVAPRVGRRVNRVWCSVVQSVVTSKRVVVCCESTTHEEMRCGFVLHVCLCLCVCVVHVRISERGQERQDRENVRMPQTGFFINTGIRSCAGCVCV